MYITCMSFELVDYLHNTGQSKKIQRAKGILKTTSRGKQQAIVASILT